MIININDIPKNISGIYLLINVWSSGTLTLSAKKCNNLKSMSNEQTAYTKLENLLKKNITAKIIKTNNIKSIYI